MTQSCKGIVAIDRRLDVFVVKQQPKFEIGNGGDSPERHLLPIVIAQGAVELLGARERVVIAGMIIAIEDRIDLVESAGRNVPVPVTLFEKLPRILDNLEGRRTQPTRIDTDICGVQPKGAANFPEIVGLCLRPLGDNQNSVVTRAPSQFPFELFTLSFPRRIVAGHQCFVPKLSAMNGTPP